MVWLQEVLKEEDSEVQTLTRRHQMMQRLLAVLDSAAAISKGPAPSHFIPMTEGSHEFITAAGMERYIQYVAKVFNHLKNHQIHLDYKWHLYRSF